MSRANASSDEPVAAAVRAHPAGSKRDNATSAKSPEAEPHMRSPPCLPKRRRKDEATATLTWTGGGVEGEFKLAKRSKRVGATITQRQEQLLSLVHQNKV